MLYTKGYFEQILSELEMQIENNNKELRSCPEGTVRKETRAGQPYIFMVNPRRDGREERRLINKQPELLQRLLRRNYLICENAALEHDVKLLRNFIKSFQDTMPSTLLSEMPKRLRSFSPELFFPQAADAWQEQEYEQSDYKPEAKVHRSSRGLLLRSKSELSIAELFYVYEVPFHYEQVLHFGKHKLVPDFMLKNKRTGKLYYWEHCGLVNNPSYMEHHRWKLGVYEKAGIAPWDNLIVTYDGADGNLNLAIVESEIKNKLL